MDTRDRVDAEGAEVPPTTTPHTRTGEEAEAARDEAPGNRESRRLATTAAPDVRFRSPGDVPPLRRVVAEFGRTRQKSLGQESLTHCRKHPDELLRRL